MWSDSYTSFRAFLYTAADITTGDVTTTAMDDLISVAEEDVNRRLRVKEMETSLNVTISASTASIPAGYRELVSRAYLAGTPSMPLEKKPAEWIQRNYPNPSSTGRPKFFAEATNQFIFGPPPNSAYVMNGEYYAEPASLPGTATINSVFSAHPDVYLYAALFQLETALKRPDQIQLRAAQYGEALDRANAQDLKRRWSGGPLSMSPG